MTTIDNNPAAISAPQLTPRAGRRWATLVEAAAYGRTSRWTLHRLAREGRITIYRPRGGKSLVDLDELDAAITGSSEPIPEAACG